MRITSACSSRSQSERFRSAPASSSAGFPAGGPVLGVLGNVWGIRAAPTGGALANGPALGLYGRAIAHEGREPELAELPAEAV
jgi:hypothetical protein